MPSSTKPQTITEKSKQKGESMSIKSPLASASMAGGKNVISIMRPTTVM
jgi:hypothetical protein